MTGRHRGAHRDETSERRRRVAQISTLLLLAVVGWVAVRAASSGSGCDDVRLSVIAAPEISPAVNAVASDWAASLRASDGPCVTVTVTAAAPAGVAASIARSAGATVRGVGPVGDTAPAKVDVWIPDSSAWLDRLRAAAAGLVPDTADSIATSPVVLGMPEPVAKTLGWPDAPVTWARLLQAMTSGAGLKVGIVDPTTDSVGLAGLMALGAAARASGAKAQENTVAAMRALVGGRAIKEADLLARFPKTTATIPGGLGAAPLSERALIEFNAAGPAVPLAGLYPQPAPPALDYPYVIMPRLDTARATLAGQLRAALAGSSYQARLAEANLRSADGRAGFTPLPGAPARVTATPTSRTAIGTAVASWISVTMPARMLAVIDVSGSMLTPVPTAGGATRGQISVAAAKQGLSLFDDSWSVGLWTFSTRLDGANDYRQLVPIGPMASVRAELLKAIDTVVPKEGGETGLYDTSLAAYRTVQEGWAPDAVNSVVILTDGINRDDNGLTLPQLVAELKKTVDPVRPIQFIAIGIGDQVSEAELKQIVTVTGGGVFIARDPSAIGEIFLKAIALRPTVGY